MFKFLTGKVGAYIAGILLVASLTTTGVFYIQNSGLTTKLDNVTLERDKNGAERDRVAGELATAMEANKTITNQLAIMQGSNKINDTVAAEIVKNNEAIKNQFDGLRILTEKRYADINKRWAEKEQTPKNIKDRRVELGFERARGTWRMYCNSEPKAVECTE